MPNYQNAIIYKITCNTTGLVYIGSTTTTLHKRMICHKCKSNKSKSKIIIIENNYSSIVLEKYPCNSKKELGIRERYYIETTPNTINKHIPTRTREEWYKTNESRLKKGSVKWNKNNPEKLKYYQDYHREKSNNTRRITNQFQRSWGGDKRHNNNLLVISSDIFM